MKPLRFITHAMLAVLTQHYAPLLVRSPSGKENLVKN
jgi:hypothetical protein